MKLDTATEIVNETLKNKQNPDKVTYSKQWNEFGQLKGWWVSCQWLSEDDEATVSISFDVTLHYTKMIGDLHAVPDYTPGVHQTV